MPLGADTNLRVDHLETVDNHVVGSGLDPKADQFKKTMLVSSWAEHPACFGWLWRERKEESRWRQGAILFPCL